MSATDNELKTIKYTAILVGLAVVGGLAWGAWKRRNQKNNFNNLVGTNFVWKPTNPKTGEPCVQGSGENY